MAKTRNASKRAKAGQPQGAAASFLKNGPRNASRVTKRNDAHRKDSKTFNHRRPYPPRARGRIDPTLLVKDAVGKSKHQTYYEIVENTEKKKKIEFKITDNPDAPPGYTFVPIGFPELTQKCKDLSRDQDVMMFIVSASGERQKNRLGDHQHRLGFHFRSLIVDEASTEVDVQGVRRGGILTIQSSAKRYQDNAGNEFYPLPATQEELNKQADAAIRDLYPRIPHTDRQQIIDHAFQLHGKQSLVGIQQNIPLPRRVQLAVLAHIRHTHTRYDKLLRETDWATARASIEAACLEVLIKWRGDEETGRDQMDEILREVVVISDSEDTDSEETANEGGDDMEEGEVADADVEMAEPPSLSSHQPPNVHQPRVISLLSPPHRAAGSDAAMPYRQDGILERPGNFDSRLQRQEDRRAQRNERKGFKRYQAWNEALSRQQNEPDASSDNRPRDGIRQNEGNIHEHPRSYQDTQRNTAAHVFASQQPYPGDLQRTTTAQVPLLQTATHKATIRGGGEFIDLTESPFREKVMSGSLMGARSHFEPLAHRDTRVERHEFSQSGQHSLLVRDRVPHGPQPTSPFKNTLQDFLVPSIEQAPDRCLEDQRNVSVSHRMSELQSRAPKRSTRGYPLSADGTYRDGDGVVRNEDDRRIIYIDDNNREVDTSRRFASKVGEGSSAGTLNTRSSIHLSAMHNPGHAKFESYSGLVEARPGDFARPGDLREAIGSASHHSIHPLGRQSSSFTMLPAQDISSRQPGARRLLPEANEDYPRATGDFSRVVRPSSTSRFSENHHGVARPEQFSHSSSHLRESVVYDQRNFEEPILISETRNGAVRYFQEPSYAPPRTQYEEMLPPRRPTAPAGQHDAPRRQVVEYIDLDRPMSDQERNMQDRYAVRHPDVRPEIRTEAIPMDQAGVPQHDLPIRNGRPRGQDYLY